MSNLLLTAPSESPTSRRGFHVTASLFFFLSVDMYTSHCCSITHQNDVLSKRNQTCEKTRIRGASFFFFFFEAKTFDFFSLFHCCNCSSRFSIFRTDPTVECYPHVLRKCRSTTAREICLRTPWPCRAAMTTATLGPCTTTATSIILSRDVNRGPTARWPTLLFLNYPRVLRSLHTSNASPAHQRSQHCAGFLKVN
jgi:hypothetical protein